MAYHSPCFGIKVNTTVMDTKKDVGETFLLIPRSGLRIAFYQDKQLSQPTPIAYYIMTYAQYPHGHIFAYRYNTLGMDASLRYLLVNQSCEVRS